MALCADKRLAGLLKAATYQDGCKACDLGATRNHLVFGVGPHDATVMLVGEGPGRQEDLTGEPFVGAAGQFLDELLAAAGIDRSTVYITNVVKCRPPDNREPEPYEILTCGYYLVEQIKAIQPKLMCSLGNPATKTLLAANFRDVAYPGITKLRGTFAYTGGGRLVLPMFHPAAALYDDEKKATCFADFALVGKFLRGEVDLTRQLA